MIDGEQKLSNRKEEKDSRQQELFPSQYEEDYLLRTLGDTVKNADVALSELVANAWDAGASNVDVTVPDRASTVQTLVVEDDGSGLTLDQFHERWMTLAYNRLVHQGQDAEFPPGRQGRRRAYGRNGQGRHGLLCFGNAYSIESWRDGTIHQFEVRASKGAQPFESQLIRSAPAAGHGTRLSVDVVRNPPDADRVRLVLSSKFLHDPGFTVRVNGTSIELYDLPGFTERRILHVADPESDRDVVVEVIVVQGESGRTKHQSGVAFWVGGRLVGTPGWEVMGVPCVDGRTRAGRRITFIVRSDDLHDQVNSDWTGFRRTMITELVGKEVIDNINEILRQLFADRVRETTREVLAGYESQMELMSPGEQVELVEVAEAIAHQNPLVSVDVLSAAITGVIDAKQNGAPLALVKRILALPEEDQEGLARLLDEWSVRDALTVLDEIGRRIKVVEALEKLMGDKSVDEVHVLHPLVTQARWLFGPEYESPQYASNVGLRRAVQTVLGIEASDDAFTNSRKRPDLLMVQDGTVSAVATEDFDTESGIAHYRKMLLIELKRGGFRITRKEMNQAGEYVEELMGSSILNGVQEIHAFVVGFEIDPKTAKVRKVGAHDQGRIEAVTFNQLVQTASARLFRLRTRVEERYPASGSEFLKQLLGDTNEMRQLGLPLTGSKMTRSAVNETEVQA